MAQRGPIGVRILAGLVAFIIGTVAALMVIFGHHAKTPATAPASPSEVSSTNGA